MILPLRNDLDEFPHPARVLGAMWWCLVRKKDDSLQFCIDFCHLNACMKKDSYPLPRIQEAGEFGRCWTFFLLRSEIRFLADKDGRGIKAVHCLHSR